MMKPTLFLLAAIVATPALAEIEVSFREGAPKDRFTLVNRGTCTLSDARVTIELEGSAAGLVFDTTAAGAGVEVFQPFEVVAGRKALAALPDVTDGDRSVVLAVDSLAAGGEIAFTIDVDDTAKGREITVADSELSGASARVERGGESWSATFGAKPVLRIAGPPCEG